MSTLGSTLESPDTSRVSRRRWTDLLPQLGCRQETGDGVRGVRCVSTLNSKYSLGPPSGVDTRPSIFLGG